MFTHIIREVVKIILPFPVYLLPFSTLNSNSIPFLFITKNSPSILYGSPLGDNGGFNAINYLFFIKFDNIFNIIFLLNILMGIINEKTNSDEILNILKNHPIIKNQNDINNNNEPNEGDDFNVIRGIINEYEELKKPLEKKNLRNSIKTNEFNLHQLERIKKWIQMASTKSLRESKVFANTVNFSNNNNHNINDNESTTIFIFIINL